MPKKSKFKLFAFGDKGDLFGWIGLPRTPKTAIRVSLKDLKFKK